ncbi:ketoacyl-ACP synthase III [Candidatus Bipolaricaulota bacterium]|nr:ketoacyl-ACP synthase III [Candidatus Bipolaricaulota bacterium]
MGARIVGSGSYVPETCITNLDLEKRVNTSDEWIVRRTGIRTRYHLTDEEDPARMGIEAGRRALDQADVSGESVDLLIIATNFPDMICPGSAPFIAAGLGFDQTPFFDLKAGCSGFVYGLAIANGLIGSGLYRRVLLIGQEALSRVTDWSDRKTCVLFGDGAGAVLLKPAPPGEGVLGSALHGENSKALLLNMPAGGTKFPASRETVDDHGHYLKMEGAGVFRSAVPMMAQAAREALHAASLSLADIDWVIPHQANIRIIDSLAKHLGFDRERVIVNLDRVANTSTASIPIALDEALREGRIVKGDVVVLTAFGAGVTYGATVVRI